MTWKQTLDYLFAALPMFQRVGPVAYKASLDNTYAICNLLGNPEHAFKSIHVAGTNGKGSTSHALAAILQQAGYKTGLYTSPHLKDFRERIRINGVMISRKEVIDFTQEYRDAFERIKPSFFEMTVGLAFNHFRKKKVDVAVIETGLGGRLDSTNVIMPELCIITNIGYDHMNLLGDTLQKIAAEKAGIIKHHIPVIVGESNKDTDAVFKQKAKMERAPIIFADMVIKAKSKKQLRSGFMKVELSVKGKPFFPGLMLDLSGHYQVKNIKSVLLGAELLKKNGYRISDRAVRTALKKVQTMTGLQGRWQVLYTKPLTIGDTGHNEDGFREILQQIRSIPHKQLHWVIGMVKDKETDKMLKMLPVNARYYFCQAKIPRALAAGELAEKGKQFGLEGMIIADVKRAVRTARKIAGKNDLVFVGGSTFVVGEACK